MSGVIAEASGFVREFERLRGRGGDTPAWLAPLRDSAWRRFEALGYPAATLEDWRQTDVGPIARTNFSRAAEGAAPDPTVIVPGLDPGAAHLEFLDGRLVAERPETGLLPPGSVVTSLRDALASAPERIEPVLGRIVSWENHPFAALATALVDDGAVVLLPAGAANHRPLRIAYRTSGGSEPVASHPRTIVVAGAGASTTIVEVFVGPDGSRYLTNAATEIVVGADAAIRHVRVQAEGNDAFHTASVRAIAGRDARVSLLQVDTGASLVRNDIGARLDGEGAHADVDGLYVVDGRRHVDNHTTIDHAVPNGTSHELFKGILGDEARAVFHGRVIVRPDAQKTDAKQSNRNLLLSDRALVHTRPQLEIHADDVKCTHGATIGRLDRDALFYLRSRGVGLEEARDLLIHAFAWDVLGRLPDDDLRARLTKLVDLRLPGSGGQKETG